MFRLWGKIWKDNRMLQDTVVCDDSDDTRTHKIFHGLEEICYQMDLGNPIWLDARCGISKSMIRPIFIRIISLNILNSTTWRSR